MVANRVSALFTVLACLASSCSLDEDSNPSARGNATTRVPSSQSKIDEGSGVQQAASDQPSTGWLGESLDLEAPEMELIGHVDVVDDAPIRMPHAPLDAEWNDDFVADPGPEPDLEDLDPEEVLEWISVDSDGNVYRLSWPRGFAASLHLEMEAQGLTSGFSGSVEAQTEADFGLASQRNMPQGRAGERGLKVDLQPQGTWSDGLDSRFRFAVADGFTLSHFPFRTIAHLATGGGCTGTMIGERMMLTSAHCVYASGYGVIGHTVRPRRDPSNDVPYGSATITNWIFPSASGEFLDEDLNCAPLTDDDPTDWEECFAHDIAIVRLSSALGTSTGAMGYGHITTTYLPTYDTYMRGYPNCDEENDSEPWWPSIPDPCPEADDPQVDFALYGSGQLCGAAQFKHGSCRSDGWYCTFDVACDGSPGQSGSAAYSYDTPLGNVPVALGVYSYYECTAGGCSANAYPNGMTRISPDISTLISYYGSIW